MSELKIADIPEKVVLGKKQLKKQDVDEWVISLESLCKKLDAIYIITIREKSKNYIVKSKEAFEEALDIINKAEGIKISFYDKKLEKIESYTESIVDIKYKYENFFLLEDKKWTVTINRDNENIKEKIKPFKKMLRFKNHIFFRIYSGLSFTLLVLSILGIIGFIFELINPSPSVSVKFRNIAGIITISLFILSLSLALIFHKKDEYIYIRKKQEGILDWLNLYGGLIGIIIGIIGIIVGVIL